MLAFSLLTIRASSGIAERFSCAVFLPVLHNFAHASLTDNITSVTGAFGAFVFVLTLVSFVWVVGAIPTKRIIACKNSDYKHLPNLFFGRLADRLGVGVRIVFILREFHYLWGRF
jgi:hypothetical protein